MNRKELFYKIYSFVTREKKKYNKLTLSEKTDLSLKSLEDVFYKEPYIPFGYGGYNDPLTRIWLLSEKEQHLNNVKYFRTAVISIQISDNHYLDYINDEEIVELDLHNDKSLTRTPNLKGGGWRKGKYSIHNQFIDRELIYKSIKEVPEEGIEIEDLNEYYELYRRILYNEGKYLKLRKIN